MMRSAAVWLFLVGVLAAGVLYLANSFLYLTPPNPVKARWLPLIVGLAHPLFVQNWHLFAPDPIRSNYVLSVRCRTAATVTPWIDVTQAMLGRHHRDRISPMSRLLRVHQNAIRLALGFSNDEWRQLACRRDPRSAVCRRDSPAAQARREEGLHLLRRTASARCDEVVGAGATMAVQMQILIHTPPPWSRRQAASSDGTTRAIPFPWTAYEPAR